MALLLRQRPSDLLGLEGGSLERFLFDREILSRHFEKLKARTNTEGGVKSSMRRLYGKLGIPWREES
jgi:hypothetical protein